jgi:hypothetical protein
MKILYYFQIFFFDENIIIMDSVHWHISWISKIYKYKTIHPINVATIMNMFIYIHGFINMWFNY